jgi:hypothetical protein
MNHRRRGAACWPAWLLAFALPAQALDLHADHSGLDPGEAARADAVRSFVVQQLPPKWSDALGEVRLEWRDDLPADVHGRAFDGRILLRRSLLREAGERPARAALVHELAHLYDRSAGGGLSRDPRLLDLAGWQDAPLRPWRTGNHFTDRTPDVYELASPREYVAVNLEHYLLDDRYACRRPALARYFDDRFGQPRATTGCTPDLPFIQAAEDASDPVLELDPARVYAVDYLLAEGNDRAMSRWGHSMLRLVVCAPGRPPGPDCRLDLAWHEVLSFRAFVDDVQISSWRGLTGSYPSRLFLLPLAQVVDEYTKSELRGLRSIPLRLQPGEIATLLQRAAQLHWSYDGRYYFIGNNCAVETARLLRDGVERLRAVPLMSITPTGLLRRLEDAGMADTAVLRDRREATRTGYYFPPLSARYQAMFEVARDALELPQRNVQDWLALPPAQRAAVFSDADLRASAALLLLEEAALRRLELETRDTLKHRLSRPARDSAQAVLAIEDTLTRPSSFAPDGYGLPQAGELAAIDEDARELADRLRQQRSALMARARALLPAADRQALVAAEANVAALGGRLRTLHEASGGVRLDR